MPDYPAIDIHFHMYATPQAAINAMGGRARVGYTGTPEEAIPFMAEANIDAAVMLNFTPVWDMAQAPRRRWQGDLTPEAEERIRADLADRLQRRNQWSCEASREHPQLIPLIGADPVLGDQMEAEVEARHREGARSIKPHPPPAAPSPPRPTPAPSTTRSSSTSSAASAPTGSPSAATGASATPGPTSSTSSVFPSPTTRSAPSSPATPPA